jgi:phosphodiesterase/alkaline phosphatase D-like protein
MSWDDHEVDNNYAGDFDENGTPPEIFVLPPRRRLSGVLRDDAAARQRAAVRQPHAALSALQFGNLIDLSVSTRAVAIGSAVRRRQPYGLRRSAAIRPGR